MWKPGAKEQQQKTKSNNSILIFFLKKENVTLSTEYILQLFSF